MQNVTTRDRKSYNYLKTHENPLILTLSGAIPISKEMKSLKFDKKVVNNTDQDW